MVGEHYENRCLPIFFLSQQLPALIPGQRLPFLSPKRPASRHAAGLALFSVQSPTERVSSAATLPGATQVVEVDGLLSGFRPTASRTQTGVSPDHYGSDIMFSLVCAQRLEIIHAKLAELRFCYFITLIFITKCCIPTVSDPPPIGD